MTVITKLYNKIKIEPFVKNNRRFVLLELLKILRYNRKVKYDKFNNSIDLKILDFYSIIEIVNLMDINDKIVYNLIYSIMINDNPIKYKNINGYLNSTESEHHNYYINNEKEKIKIESFDEIIIIDCCKNECD